MLTLVSHQLCPYVQRAAILLQEKGVKFQRRTIDLANKPDWFKEISPLGKVPLLQVGSAVIFESAVILEYLEETLPHPLHPDDPVERARHRAWMEFGSSILADISQFYNASDLLALDAVSERLKQKFARLEAELAQGLWFAGPQFSLVDAVFGPVFRYFDAFDAIGEFRILYDLPKLQAWRRALAARPSIVSAVAEDYPDRLMSFLAARPSQLARLVHERRTVAV